MKWTSSDPRPLVPGNQKGRVTILATAIGEDSFVDTSSNGFYDTGEVFADLGEPYKDDNENDTYDLGEYFVDFDTNGTRGAGDGVFSGITCTGITPGSTCGLTTTSIGGQTVIIMSTSGAKILNPTVDSGTTIAVDGSGAISLQKDTTASLKFTVRDDNDNAMPAQTKIVTTQTAAGDLSGQTDVTVPCDDSQLGTQYVVTLKAPATVGIGSITVKVTTPRNLVTTRTFAVTITN